MQHYSFLGYVIMIEILILIIAWRIPIVRGYEERIYTIGWRNKTSILFFILRFANSRRVNIPRCVPLLLYFPLVLSLSLSLSSVGDEVDHDSIGSFFFFFFLDLSDRLQRLEYCYETADESISSVFRMIEMIVFSKTYSLQNFDKKIIHLLSS